MIQLGNDPFQELLQFPEVHDDPYGIKRLRPDNGLDAVVVTVEPLAVSLVLVEPVRCAECIDYFCFEHGQNIVHKIFQCNIFYIVLGTYGGVPA